MGDVLVTVNFTALANTSTAYIFLSAYTGDVDMLRSSTLPFPLNAGVHIRGHAISEAKETLDNPDTAFWGLWPVSHTSR